MDEAEIYRSHYATITQRLYKGKTILLYGPRQVGKTFLVKKLVKEAEGKYYNVELHEVQDQLSTTNSAKLKAFIGEDKLIVLDEIQTMKNAGAVLKVIHDTFPNVQIIATGSSAYELINAMAEPLLGRSRNYVLYPPSYGEIKQSIGFVEAYARIESMLRFGCYPEVVFKPDEEKKNVLKLISANSLYRDALSLGGIRRPDLIREILILLAYQIGQEVSLNEISNKTNTNVHTVQRYLYLLEQSFVITSLGSLSRNLRNEIGKSRKYYFVDLGIRNALINNFNPLKIRNDIGQLWENFCVIERMKKNENTQRHVNTYFWRTYEQKEIDYIEEIDGKLCAFEFKWKEPAGKLPKLFLEAYPGSEYKVITKENFREFV